MFVIVAVAVRAGVKSLLVWHLERRRNGPSRSLELVAEDCVSGALALTVVDHRKIGSNYKAEFDFLHDVVADLRHPLAGLQPFHWLRSGLLLPCTSNPLSQVRSDGVDETAGGVYQAPPSFRAVIPVLVGIPTDLHYLSCWDHCYCAPALTVAATVTETRWTLGSAIARTSLC